MECIARLIKDLPLSVGIAGVVKLAPDSGTFNQLKIANLQYELIRSGGSNL